jgi:DNA-binding SARP family transcriptional activator
MASSRISAMRFSPSAVFSAILASASALALSRSSFISALVLAMMFWASARASASALL